MKINLEHLSVRPATKFEEPRYQELMQQHHYLGDLAKIGHTLWYVATYGEEWAALLSFQQPPGNVVPETAGLAGVTGINIAALILLPTIAVFSSCLTGTTPTLAPKSSLSANVESKLIGRRILAKHDCFWKPSSIRHVFMARFTERQTGIALGKLKAIDEPVQATTPTTTRPNWFSFVLYKGTRKHSSRVQS